MVAGHQFKYSNILSEYIINKIFFPTLLVPIIAYITCFYSQTINILELGAKGDNIQDNTQIIQKALNIAEKRGGGTVLIPTAKGSYNISETLFIGSNTKVIFGDSFIKLSNYTSIGTVLANKKGATNIEIINPMIDGNNISSGGTGENGISFGDGGTCHVIGGIIKNCRSGTIAHKLGGKGFQVEDKNVKLFKVERTKIFNCTFALSSQYNLKENTILNSSINVVYDNITAENCDSFLLLQQVDGLNEVANRHNVTISNFKVINCGKEDGIFIFSRARGAKIFNGDINGDFTTTAIIRGRHSDMLFNNINITQPIQNIIDLRPSFHGNASTKSENNKYNIKVLSDYVYLVFSSADDQYSFRELFNSKVSITSKKIYNKNLILPQSIYKSSTLIFNQINKDNKFLSKEESGFLDLYNKKN